MQRVILHLDMDAFYASVEQRDDPKLRGQPVIVGAPPTQRGVVCAASYEARKFGVRSALPSATAGRLCPKGIFVRPRMDAYREESRRIMEIIATTGAIVEQMSVDEAYLGVSAMQVLGLGSLTLKYSSQAGLEIELTRDEQNALDQARVLDELLVLPSAFELLPSESLLRTLKSSSWEDLRCLPEANFAKLLKQGFPESIAALL